MTTLKRPGVFLDERPALAILPGGTIGTSTGALIGASNRGPTTPTLVTSYSQFTKYFNDVSVTNDPLSFHALSFFANGGSRLYAVAVRGAGAAVATRTLTDRAATPVATLVVNAVNSGAWGNNIYIDISDTPGTGSPATQFDITIYYNGATNAYVVERFTGLTMDSTQTNYALTVVNNLTNGSKFISLAQPATPSTTVAPGNLPAAQLGTRLANGLDGAAPADSDWANSVSAFDAIQEPLNFGLPGATVTQQSNAVSYCDNRGDCFMACELPTTTLTASAAITAASAFLASSYGAVYWPAVNIADPASKVPGATRLQTVTGAVLGLISLTDATRGIQKAPAGLTARIAGALSPQVIPSTSDLDSLNVAQVNAIRFIPGSGNVVMGARTLKSGANDRYVPVRRSLIYVRVNLLALTQFAVFEPNTTVTRYAVSTTLDRFLRSAWRSGMLKGSSPEQAYYIVCDDTNNDTTSVSQGVINVEVGVSLVTPAEFIVIKLGSFDGALSVSGG